MLRYGSATIVEPSISSDTWQKSVCCGHKGGCACGTNKCRTKIARTILAKYDPEKWLLSHCSIIAAVDVEEAKESKSDYKDYLIKPEYSKYVNNNGDAWTKALLAKTYRTFIGSNNYLEHIQIPELAKGKVIDAVLREVPIGKDKAGKDITTYYVDILVATERKHKDLVRKIEAGELRTLSMGCKIAFSICTKCGNKAVDEAQACDHVRYEKNNTFYDEMGTQRKVGELCGHISDGDSVTFIDASWVANPAFTGAVVRNVVNPPEDIMAKIKDAEKKNAYEYQELDFLKAANKTAQEPKDAPAKDELPAEKTPAEESPEAPAEEAAPEAEVPAGNAPEALPEDYSQSDIQTWKSQIKKKLLKQLTDEINSELSGEPEDDEARELDTLDENLIQPSATAALKQMHKMKQSWDKYLKKTAGHLDEKSYYKLKFGTYMLLTSNDMTILKDYGYNRRDFLAVLSSLDGCFRRPLAMEIKKALAELGGTNKMAIDKASYALQKLAGRKLNADELKKALVWLKLMDFYQE